MENKILYFQGNIVRFASVDIDAESTKDKYTCIDAYLSANFRPEDIRKLKMSPVDKQETTVSVQVRGGNMRLQMYILVISWKSNTHDA